MARTTITDLQRLALRLNTTLNRPVEPYTNGKANIGNFHISQAYGGYALHVMVNEDGGISDVLRNGHCTAKELATAIHAFLASLEFKQSN